MNNLIGPTVKHVWNAAMHVVQIYFRVCHKDNSLSLGLIRPSCPSTKDLHDRPVGASNSYDGIRFKFVLVVKSLERMNSS